MSKNIQTISAVPSSHETKKAVFVHQELPDQAKQVKEPTNSVVYKVDTGNEKDGQKTRVTE